MKIYYYEHFFFFLRKFSPYLYLLVTLPLPAVAGGGDNSIAEGINSNSINFVEQATPQIESLLNSRVSECRNDPALRMTDLPGTSVAPPFSLLSHLAKLFDGKIVDEHEIVIRFKGISIPIYLVAPAHSGAYKLFITHPKNKTSLINESYHFMNHCFEFSIFPLEQRGFIDAIVAPQTKRAGKIYDCPLPKEASGNLLLQLAEKISRDFKLREVKLHDSATLQCEESEHFTSLSFLGLMTRGWSWYEKNGYVPPDYPKFRATSRSLRDYPLAKVIGAISEVKRNGNPSRDPESLLSTYLNDLQNDTQAMPYMEKFLKNHPKSTLADLFTNAWGMGNKESCHLFIALKTVLFPLRQEGELSEIFWSVEIPRYEWLSSFYAFESDHILKKSFDYE